MIFHVFATALHMSHQLCVACLSYEQLLSQLSNVHFPKTVLAELQNVTGQKRTKPRNIFVLDSPHIEGDNLNRHNVVQFAIQIRKLSQLGHSLCYDERPRARLLCKTLKAYPELTRILISGFFGENFHFFVCPSVPSSSNLKQHEA